MMKTCTRCKKDKPLSEFHQSKQPSKEAPGVKRYQSYCKECGRIASNSDYLAHKSRRLITRASGYLKHGRAAHFRRKYGLTIADVARMRALQRHKCPILDRVDEDLVVDHDHHTNKVRGLLSRQANMALGLLGDDPEAFERAAAYLRAHACHSD